MNRPELFLVGFIALLITLQGFSDGANEMMGLLTVSEVN
jgi:hypothetical protein